MVVALGLVACAPASPASPRDVEPDTSASPAASVPAFGHVYLLLLENHGLADVLGNPAAPYLNSLAERYGSATAYRSITHPSQPNYIALFSGSPRQVTDDNAHDLAAPNLADQIEASGRTWRVFAENVPAGCFTGAFATGGPDGPGTYARKHEPAISFTSISSRPERCANIADFAHFGPAAADFELIVPNLCHDMHDCSLAESDRFLASFVPRILDSDAWRSGGLLLITFDEGDEKASDTLLVPLLAVAPGIAPGTRSATPHTHYSLLRTIEASWGLGCLAESCEANDLAEFFAPASGSTAMPSPSVGP